MYIIFYNFIYGGICSTCFMFFEAMAMVFQKFPLGFMGGVAGWA